MNLPKSFTTITPLSIILATVLFITLPIAGFYLGMQYEQAILFAEGMKRTESERLALTSSPTPTPDETANWKTYRNDEYGFEFEYPSEWLYKETLPNTPDNAYSWPPLFIFFAPEPVSPGIVWITIDLSDYSLDEYIDNELCDAPGVCASSKNSTALQIDGYQVRRVLDMPGPLSTENILLKKASVIYRFSISYQDKSYEDLYTQDQKREIFSQILSTFEFIE